MKITSEVEDARVSDVITYLDVDGGTFVAKLLTTFKKESIENVKESKIDFSEFVLSIWSFCSIQTSSLRKLVPVLLRTFFLIFLRVHKQIYFASKFIVNFIGNFFLCY